jgi:hypothetical protein
MLIQPYIAMILTTENTEVTEDHFNMFSFSVFSVNSVV